ncbi:MAG: hypothetical protein IPO08_22915 [Xanthomonadales bacterium]|nr:hypothetical protein [Xanthomonadales bacterium]
MNVREALAAVMVLPNSAQLSDMRKMLAAMIAEYQDNMLDAKPEQLPVLQAYCRQTRQIMRALTDPATHTPTL